MGNFSLTEVITNFSYFFFLKKLLDWFLHSRLNCSHFPLILSNEMSRGIDFCHHSPATSPLFACSICRMGMIPVERPIVRRSVVLTFMKHFENVKSLRNACKTAVNIRETFLPTYMLCVPSKVSVTTFRLSFVFTEKRRIRTIFWPHLPHANKCLNSSYFGFHRHVFIVIIAVPGK